MEVLIPAIFELIVLAIPVFCTLIELLVMSTIAAAQLVGLIVEAILYGSLEAALAARKKTKAGEPVDETLDAKLGRFTRWLTSPKTTRRLRKSARVASVFLAITTFLLLVANFVFLENIVRWGMTRVEASTGTSIEFKGAEGNLFTGLIKLNSVAASRKGHDVSDFDIQVENIVIDLSVTTLLSREFRFDAVEVSGIRGDYKRFGKAPKKQKRPLVIDVLAVDDVDIHFSDESRAPKLVAIDLVVESLRVDNLSSRWAAFDILFKSNTTGKLDGKAFQVTNQKQGLKHTTLWNGTGLPVFLAGSYLGGPFAWLTDGRLDIETVTRWTEDDNNTDIEMHWKISVHDLKAEVPPGLNLIEQGFVKPAVAFLNRNPMRLPIEFDLVLDKNGFEGRLSPFTKDLLIAVGESAKKKLAEVTGIAEEKIDGAVDKAKKFLGDFVKPKQK